MREIPYCFQCWPGGPVTPPPCRKCGSTKEYYTSGLCARCHPHSAGERSVGRPGYVVDSCPDCLAWGTTRMRNWVCKACEHWRSHHPVAQCPICGRMVPVTDGACRLCTRQRTLILRLVGRDLTLAEANRHGQQLFLVDMVHRNSTGRRRPTSTRGPTPPAVPPRTVTHRQPVLFETAHDLNRGMRYGFPSPPDATVETYLMQLANEHAKRYGWGRTTHERTRRGIRILLGIQDTPGAPIKASEVSQLATIGIGAPAVRRVLAAADLLEDDRQPTIERWFTHRVAELPEPMRAELQVWFDIMRHGSTSPPRRHPRAESTIYSQLDFAFPALRTWARDHRSLREIGREEFLALLPAGGTPRATLITSCRSIFKILKGRKVVFTDPTHGITGVTTQKRQPLPVEVAILQQIVNSDDVTLAALAALIAFHGLTGTQMTRLQLTDLHDGRLHVAGRAILLAPPVKDRLDAWLDYRARRWPNTANPHLFITIKSAVHTGPARPLWISRQLGIASRTIRQDRIIDEVIATGGDVRLISDMFGLSVWQANRYNTVLDPPNLAEYERARRTGD